MLTIENDLRQALTAALKQLGINTANKDQIQLEHPANVSFGDYSSNVAMMAFGGLDANAKSRFSNPRALATAIQQQLQATSQDSQVWSEVSVAGPGFINFKLSQAWLWHQALEVAQGKLNLPDIGQGKTAIVEYSSPNIAKPFTIGHLRSTIIGDAVAMILEATGWKVRRDNHLGDWGTQFGKLVCALQLPEMNAKSLEEIDQLERPVKYLVELYVKFHEEAETKPELEDQARAWFKKLEDGDATARDLWQRCVNWSWKEFSSIYERLDVKFDPGFDGGKGLGEAFFEDKMAVVLTELETKTRGNDADEAKPRYMTGKGGAKLFFFPNEELPPLMILKQDGATLYATRDLATDYYRLHELQPTPDLIINEVGIEQALYFQQLYRIEELLGWVKPGQRVHIRHGHYRFQDRKMSTRKGNVIWLEDVLDQAVERAATLAKDGGMPDVAEQVGLGALKWNDLKRSSHLDIVFDWDEILNLKGNSGPYLQYTYVRAQSILKKASVSNSAINASDLGSENHENRSIAKHSDIFLNSLTAMELPLLQHLYRYPEVVGLAAKEYSPHHVATYLYELAQAFNSFYNSAPVLGEKVAPEVTQMRLIVTQAVVAVIAHGLGLLGIKTVEKM